MNTWSRASKFVLVVVLVLVLDYEDENDDEDEWKVDTNVRALAVSACRKYF